MPVYGASGRRSQLSPSKQTRSSELRVRSRTIESSNAAVAAEVVKRAVGAELIRRKISVPLDEAEVIRGDHVVEIALSPTDGAVTLADTGELGSSLKTDASAMA